MAFFPAIAAVSASTWAATAAVVSAVGMISQAQSAKSAANYNAAVAERNATVSRQQAAANEAAQRRENYRAMGRIRAGYGAAGVTPEGSPLDILESSAAEAELDALNTRYKGELTAIGYQDEATLQRSRASSAMTAGVLNAGSALLSGAGKSYAGTSLLNNSAPGPLSPTGG